MLSERYPRCAYVPRTPGLAQQIVSRHLDSLSAGYQQMKCPRHRVFRPLVSALFYSPERVTVITGAIAPRHASPLLLGYTFGLKSALRSFLYL